MRKCTVSDIHQKKKQQFLKGIWSKSKLRIFCDNFFSCIFYNLCVFNLYPTVTVSFTRFFTCMCIQFKINILPQNVCYATYGLFPENSPAHITGALIKLTNMFPYVIFVEQTIY